MANSNLPRRIIKVLFCTFRSLPKASLCRVFVCVYMYIWVNEYGYEFLVSYSFRFIDWIGDAEASQWTRSVSLSLSDFSFFFGWILFSEEFGLCDSGFVGPAFVVIIMFGLRLLLLSWSLRNFMKFEEFLLFLWNLVSGMFVSFHAMKSRK